MDRWLVVRWIKWLVTRRYWKEKRRKEQFSRHSKRETVAGLDIQLRKKEYYKRTQDIFDGRIKRVRQRLELIDYVMSGGYKWTKCWFGTEEPLEM